MENKPKELKKCKVIIFGATKFIYDAAKEGLNFDNVEIKAFVDNDPRKYGLFYEKIEIISPNQLSKVCFDYVLVGAWYSYFEIYTQLISLGIHRDKILPLFKEKSIYLLTEILENIDSDIIFKLFINGENLLRDIEINNNVNLIYERMPKILDKRKSIDFNNYPIIAHACGGYIKGEKREYTNSLQAFQEALSSGFKMFECDVWGIQDGKIMLGSRLKMQCQVDLDYTILTLDSLLQMIAGMDDKRVVLDIKWNTLDDFCRCLVEIDKLVKEFEKKGFKNIRHQIIIETFDEETTEKALKADWECMLTDYRNPEGMWYKKSALICCKFNVYAVLIDAQCAISNAKYIKYFIDKNIDVVCYTVDEIEDYVRLKQIGVKSVLSNFIKPPR